MSERDSREILGEPLDTEEVGLEAPEADAVEQHQPLTAESSQWPSTIPLDADEADAADQEKAVDLDEDDYR